MGPLCPNCQESVEWTQGEIFEEIYSDKVYFCSKCYQSFAVDFDALIEEQEKCKKAIKEGAWKEEGEDG